MNTRIPSLLAMLALMAVVTSSQAYDCSVSSPGFSTPYDPNQAGRTVVQSSATITCSKAAGESSTMNFTLGANNGQNGQGANNRAILGTGTIAYDLYRDSNCSTSWRSPGGGVISDTLIFATSTSGTKDVTYWGCIAAALSPPAGIYTDLVTMTLSYGNNNPLGSNTGTFPVSIAVGWSCSLSPGPGTVDFGTYVAFGGAIQASTSFGITCSQTLPYTMSLNATSGTVVGLNYTLSLSTTSSTGLGALQTHQINGNMIAGQAGTCGTASCTGSQPHMLTLTY